MLSCPGPSASRITFSAAADKEQGGLVREFRLLLVFRLRPPGLSIRRGSTLLKLCQPPLNDCACIGHFCTIDARLLLSSAFA